MVGADGADVSRAEHSFWKKHNDRLLRRIAQPDAESHGWILISCVAGMALCAALGLLLKP